MRPLMMISVFALLWLVVTPVQADLPKETVSKGLIMIKMGQLSEASALFKDATNRYPGDALAYFYLALAYEK
ncbi:MAG: hypothetical protein NC911_09555, partial [Candidatus Omnitrophica bacterium]|nr:hypothetical protein [Candidatus Omnitrophota bacterium]